ncbi:hypothetical protein EDB81DRAFT_911349 [Dactylonectria macrodidyma]|uniref:ATP-dependent DNA ligase family profile domain-containing protein n=1 Tax=Dactylonectria macrodidyma TaxID=307937 RepID=A0A9P9DT45_9HYPO|nr:hypothetical protein EDB81DRAFT_911349 [Dactylonectria macrodidyma]
MPFPFRLLCDLLQRLEWNSRRSSSIDKIQEHFASSVERVMAITDCESGAGREVTLEELDDVLDQIAASLSFLSASLRERVATKHGRSIRTDKSLSKVFRVLQSSETKWMIRIISKNYSPARVLETLVMSKFHFLLPDLLCFQNSIPAAIRFLDSPTIRHMPIQPAVDTCDELKEVASRELEPQAGIITARATYEKARSIRHCCQLAGPRRMSVERKYDGEYYQIYIDLNKSGAAIKDFLQEWERFNQRPHGNSSGTAEQLWALHSRLQNQEATCETSGPVSWSCSRFTRRIERASHDHVYDILLLDDIVCGLKTHDEWRRRLQSLVRRIPGRTDIGSREVIEFSSFDAAERLSETFARAITQRWEGFVLKGCDNTYFSFNRSRPFIKLKKDYIPGLGDTADFVIIRGRRDAGDEHELSISSLS